MLRSAIPADHPRALNLKVALEAARTAAEVVLRYYDTESAATYVKGDGSPVTDADIASDARIREVIGTAFPDDFFLTEEGVSDRRRLDASRVWIVDPIDGTAQFVGRTGLFDVMIALAVDGKVEVGVAVQPVRGLIQAAVRGAGAWEIVDGATSSFRIVPSASPARFATSKWYGGREKSAALARIAERLGTGPPPVLDVGFQSRAFHEPVRTYDAFVGLPPDAHRSIAQEWDLAAVDLIVTEAGGVFTDCWGRQHRYNKRDSGIAGGILAASDPSLHAALLDAIAPELPATAPPLDPADDPIRQESTQAG